MTDRKAEELIENIETAVKKESALVTWWNTLIKEEWILTIKYPGKVTVLPDGTRIEEGAPVDYHIKKINKITPAHFIFIDNNNHLVEIKLTSPLSYELRKIY